MIKVIYVAHPIGGDVKNNIKKVLDICKNIHTKNIIPFAPYLLSLQYLDDNKNADRQKGMLSNKEFFVRKTFDELWVYGISKGVNAEIKLAEKYGIKVVHKNGN